MGRSRIEKLGLSALCAVCGLACGGDDDGGGAVSSGLPPNTMLSQLTAQQVQESCNNVVDDLDVALTAELDRFNCTLRALPMSISVTLSGQTTGDAAKCRELRDRCLGGEDIGGADAVVIPPIRTQIQCAAPAAVAATQSCNATVGDYEACMNAIVATGQARFRALDCSLVADPAQLQQQMRVPPALPPVCAELDAQCPQLGIRAIVGA